MSKIKSKRAKDYLLNNSAHRDSKEGKEMGIVTTYVDATKAVLIAEQDAEERAVRATKSMIDGMVIATDIEKQAMMDYYNYCYNNGGQRDE